MVLFSDTELVGATLDVGGRRRTHRQCFESILPLLLTGKERGGWAERLVIKMFT